jgi:hypothetical protein
LPLETTTPAYEVRCHACNTSFAPGTKKCVHCGAPLGGAFDLAVLRASGRADTAGAEGEAAGAPSIGKFVVWALSAGLAVVVHALNTCAER